MSNGIKDVSEKAYQQKFVDELIKNGWQAPDYLNGNIKKVTVNDLINNWRQELNKLNKDILEGVELTDNEFKQVMNKVNQISNSYEAAKLLTIEQSIGKIDGIYRDSNPNITRNQITLTIFKNANNIGDHASYQIAREVSSDNDNKFDIILLINGLPLINIEQKRVDKPLSEAFRQFKRYYDENEYTNNFMAFSQMMIITTEMRTQYFATPKSRDDFNESFLFDWSDKYNNNINEWHKVIKTFLNTTMAHQMIGDYSIIYEQPANPSNFHLMLMRSYQIHALQAVVKAALDTPVSGGYVWHTTGSGKTITSFKTAQFLSNSGNFDKVVFLVDRIELDKNTVESFKAYSEYESVDVSESKSTAKLHKLMNSSKKEITVSTIHKLHKLVKKLNGQKDYNLSKKKIIFIVDEAHRTTMGQMMGDIKSYFSDNALFYGFTGTPLFEESKTKGMINEDSEVINTTKKLFGPLLHEYTIDKAILDGNVLGFNIDYINTGEFISYDDLKDKIVEYKSITSPDVPVNEIERDVVSWDLLEVEKYAKREKLLVYQDETHIPRVVSKILENWQSQSQNGKFNAILTVEYKKRVVEYYQEFKRQLQNMDDDFKPNIALTFSFTNEHDSTEIDPNFIKEAFNDYKLITGREFIVGDSNQGETAYFEDLIERFKRGGSKDNPKNIDIIIVVDQLLTGYDSKLINTLYVDREFELQNLIQAYSRTNRIYGPEKKFGSIVNFQYPEITKEKVLTALKLYGNGGSDSQVIAKPYVEVVKDLRNNIDKLKNILPDPKRWDDLNFDEENKIKFKKAFIKTSTSLNLVQQYYEYKWDDDSFGLSESQWLYYKGAYQNLFPKDDNSIDEPIRDLEGKIRLVDSQTFNKDNIIEIIDKKFKNNNKEDALQDIEKKIEELSNLGYHEKALLLQEFLVDLLDKNDMSLLDNFDEEYNIWLDNKKDIEVEKFSQMWGLDFDLLKKSFELYSLKQPGVIHNQDNIINSADMSKASNKDFNNILIFKGKVMESLSKWMEENKSKFGE